MLMAIITEVFASALLDTVCIYHDHPGNFSSNSQHEAGSKCIRAQAIREMKTERMKNRGIQRVYRDRGINFDIHIRAKNSIEPVEEQKEPFSFFA